MAAAGVGFVGEDAIVEPQRGCNHGEAPVSAVRIRNRPGSTGSPDRRVGGYGVINTTEAASAVIWARLPTPGIGIGSLKEALKCTLTVSLVTETTERIPG